MNEDRDHSNISKPVVGVFINKSRIENLNAQNHHFKGYSWFEELFKANTQAGVTLYAFAASDVESTARQITGTYLESESGTWKQRTFPYPDVLYVRGASGGENRDFRKTLRDFDDLGVKRINAQYLFDKWHLYKQLKRDKAMRNYLPRTVRIQDAADLQNFLRKYAKVYVKACYGSRGKQVAFISRLATGGYRYSYNCVGALSTGETKHIKSLYEVIQQLLGSHRILAQEAIDIIQLKKQNVDFRAEVQRNGSGNLEVVSIAARIGDTGSPITTHGDVREFRDFMRDDFGRTTARYQVLTEHVHRFLHSVSDSVERAYGPFGDLGIDFAVDRAGRLWFIECNARSAKVSFLRTADRDTIERAFINPLEYAKHLYVSGNRNTTEHSRGTDDGTRESEDKNATSDTTSSPNVVFAHTKLAKKYSTIQLKPLWSDNIPSKEFRTIILKPLW